MSVWSIFTADPDEWEFTQLRSLFGKAKDAVLRSDNRYIASSSNNKIRVWNVDRVFRILKTRTPWRAWLHFLFPLALVYIIVLQSAGTYIMRAYGLASRELAIMFLLNAMFGYSFETFWKFLLSLLVPIYPQARVENGMLVRDPDRFDYVDTIGGPRTNPCSSWECGRFSNESYADQCGHKFDLLDETF